MSFRLPGQLISRYASRGSLNVPYGLVIRQDGLLVANRGSGTVTKYTTKSFFSNDTGSTVLIGEFETPIQTPCGGILLNDGIWGLALQVSDHDNAQIFFTAAINAGTLATVTTAPVDGLVGVFITAMKKKKKRKRKARKEWSHPPPSSNTLNGFKILNFLPQRVHFLRL